MSAVAESVNASRLVLFGAAVIVGASISTMISGSAYALPAVGTVPGVALGAVGLVAGGGLYLGVKRSSKTDCGCAGDCNC